MTVLDLLLILVAIAALGWALWLRDRLRLVSRNVPPPPEPFTPLFRSATAALDTGLVVLDQEREIRYLNPQAELLLGIAHAVALGQGLIALLRDYQADRL